MPSEPLFLLSVALTATLVVLFVLSGIGKLRALTGAPQALAALRVELPHPRLWVALVSGGELALALALLVAPPGWFLPAAAAATVLLAAFLVVVIRAYRLGSTEDCGCFGDHGGTPIGPRLIVRNSLLTLTGAVLTTVALLGAARGVIPALLIDPAATSAVIGATALAAAIAYAAAPSAAAEPTAAPDQPLAAEPGRARPIVLLDPPADRVVDLRWAAASRAQLLLLVRPGCGSCSDVVDRAAAASAQLDRVVATTLVVTAKAGSALQPPAFETRGLPVLTDVGRLTADALGLPERRPVGVLIGTDGAVVGPAAEGKDEIFELIDAIVEASETSAVSGAPSEAP